MFIKRCSLKDVPEKMFLKRCSLKDVPQNLITNKIFPKADNASLLRYTSLACESKLLYKRSCFVSQLMFCWNNTLHTDKTIGHKIFQKLKALFNLVSPTKWGFSYETLRREERGFALCRRVVTNIFVFAFVLTLTFCDNFVICKIFLPLAKYEINKFVKFS